LEFVDVFLFQVFLCVVESFYLNYFDSSLEIETTLAATNVIKYNFTVRQVSSD